MPLTVEEKERIAATIPILQAGGEKLTRHFYQRMMAHNPEVRKFFNQTHQKDGTQAHALAKAVLTYAKNIDHLENLGSIAPIIIEKHIGLDIHPEHYPVVGSNLIASMVEVLGSDVATPAVVDAWTKAYNQLAAILMNAEREVYKEIEMAPGGWAHFRKFVVKKRTQTAAKVVTLWLEPEDGKPVIASRPGQYTTVRVVPSDGQEARRNYSISSAPSTKGYEISVKNIGVVSDYIHHLKEGDIIELRPPIGGFTLEAAEAGDEAGPFVFIAGGIGITPLAAMLRAGARGKLLYYAHSDSERALLKELRELDNVEYVETAGSRPTFAEIKANVPENATVFYTGPHGFMETIRSILSDLGIPPDHARYELFGSGQTLD